MLNLFTEPTPGFCEIIFSSFPHAPVDTVHSTKRKYIPDTQLHIHNESPTNIIRKENNEVNPFSISHLNSLIYKCVYALKGILKNFKTNSK